MNVAKIAALSFFCALCSTANANDYKSVEAVFAPQSKNQFVLDIEAALARTQAQQGIIPEWAAAEITKKASVRYAPLDKIAKEYKLVRHRMVALLNVWTRSMDKGAGEYVHFGTTTVDVYDTALVLQLKQTTHILLADLRQLELAMISLAEEHRDTIMVGRTRGQHALPITFGKKVSTWLGENRRNIERLQEVLKRLEKSGILKGAVGSYLGLGEQAMQTEAGFVVELGLQKPYADDWHGSRDVLAEYALVLSLISKSYGRIGSELFLLQTTDIGETEEIMTKTAVGSSTMPHKKNPSKPEALMFYARTIPRLAEVIVEDMVNTFERDDTSRTARSLAEISIETEDMLDSARRLIVNLKVKPEVMKANLEKTGGLIMAQRVTFALAGKIGKTTANAKMHDVAQYAIDNKLTLREALEHDTELSQHLSAAELDALFDATTYIGLAPQQVDAVIAEIRLKRQNDAKE